MCNILISIEFECNCCDYMDVVAIVVCDGTSCVKVNQVTIVLSRVFMYIEVLCCVSKNGARCVPAAKFVE